MKLSLSANICKLRKEKGLTQEQLAESLGVTFASVLKWERGAATPELNLIAEMRNAFLLKKHLN
ncbi:MAG: helix-turn-helix transcriptional regulator [Clostridia bacterium]|nr:helix-turn-helix transcriptional regulator [Clostridia bacterium]